MYICCIICFALGIHHGIVQALAAGIERCVEEVRVVPWRCDLLDCQEPIFQESYGCGAQGLWCYTLGHKLSALLILDLAEDVLQVLAVLRVQLFECQQLQHAEPKGKDI
jgi:hypothetical protein